MNTQKTRVRFQWWETLILVYRFCVKTTFILFCSWKGLTYLKRLSTDLYYSWEESFCWCLCLCVFYPLTSLVASYLLFKYDGRFVIVLCACQSVRILILLIIISIMFCCCQLINVRKNTDAIIASIVQGFWYTGCSKISWEKLGNYI